MNNLAEAQSDYMANWGDTKNLFDSGPTILLAGLASEGFLQNTNRPLQGEFMTGLTLPRSEIGSKHITDGTSKTYLATEASVPLPNDMPQTFVSGSVFGHGWTASAYLPPAHDREVAWDWPDLNLRYGAFHSSGFHVTMADGSVQSVDYDIDLMVHRAAANRADE